MYYHIFRLTLCLDSIDPAFLLTKLLSSSFLMLKLILFSHQDKKYLLNLQQTQGIKKQV